MTQTSYTYDLGDRLSGISPASGSAATFSFDSLGRHASRTVGSATDTYSYLGSTSTLVGISTAGVMTASLLDPTGSRLANRNMTSALATFSLPDLHGSLAAAQLTSSLTIADAFRYDAYGQTLASGGSGGGPAQPYRYQGRLDISPDAAEPLYAAGARFYQPSLGVFTQLDSVAGSVQDPLSLNRYLYAEANPTSLIDPDGHAAISGADLEGSDRVYYTTMPASPGQPPTTVEHDIWAPRPQPTPPHWQQGADVQGGTRQQATPNTPPTGHVTIDLSQYTARFGENCWSLFTCDIQPAINSARLFDDGWGGGVARFVFGNPYSHVAGGFPIVIGPVGLEEDAGAILGETQGPLIRMGGLASLEKYGGHAIARHVGLSDAALIGRFAQQPGLRAASTFESEAMANVAIDETLVAAGNEVSAWLAGSARSYNVVATSRTVLGRVSIGGEAPVAATRLEVVLLRNPQSPLGYIVQTVKLWPE